MKSLDLPYIASRLEALEETIIFVLIERIQFLHNPRCYTVDESGFSQAQGMSLFDFRLRGQEELDARFGRYLTPEERPVNRELPGAERTAPSAPTGLAVDSFDTVNLSAELEAAYLELLPRICAPGDDGQYGSSIERDVFCLQALIRRVHFAAFFVGESKFRADTDGYSALIRRRDRQAIGEKLTRPEVEQRILERVEHKCARLQEISDFSLRRVLDPADVTALYRDIIIPLTKEGEIRYLMARA